MKVGDKVKVKGNIEELEAYSGRVFTVYEVNHSLTTLDRYTLEYAGNHYTFYEEELELLE
jgi:hypothetical protein